MLTVIYLSILQHKVCFMFVAWNFSVSFSVGLVTRDETMLLAADLTACTVKQQSLILSLTINRTFIPNQALLRVKCMIVNFLSKSRNCYVRNTDGCRSICHITLVTKLNVEFSCSSLWQFFTKSCPASVRYVKIVSVTVTRLS
jgi:hypothetical protein